MSLIIKEIPVSGARVLYACSGPAQSTNNLADPAPCMVDIFSGREAAEADAEGCMSKVVRDADTTQHIRRLDRSAGAG